MARFSLGDATVLTCLRVRNLAIIDELEVELGPGLNVVTGETGAGKSILIEALELVLGARARPDLVRTGASQAEVEALFSLGPAAASASDGSPLAARLRDRLAESGIEAGSELVVRRVVTAQGRSRAYVNGTLVTLSQLHALSAGLVDISSQHEHHALAEPASVLAYLDAFAGHDALVVAMRTSFDGLANAEAALTAAHERERGRAEREDLLRFQLAELDELDPKAGEGAELVRERERLRHAEKLLSASTAAEEALYGRDGSISEELAQIGSRLAAAAALDPTLGALAEQTAAARTQLEDVARELGSYARGVSLDPERLALVDERLHALVRLGRKHGALPDADIAGVLGSKRAAARQELDELCRGEARVAELEATRERAFAAADAAAARLSKSRLRAGTELGAALERELRSLGMSGATAAIALGPLDARTGLTAAVVAPGGAASAPLVPTGTRLCASGRDVAELLVSTNPGEEALPLRSIASGGELSRTMLALKRVLAAVRGEAGRGSAGLFVFDEVDTGVGGAIGEVIGRSLADVARHSAVLCVTHLAPIAAYADRHLRVHKSVTGGRTRSEVALLDRHERVEELARMLGGLSITKKTRSVAVELLRGARAASTPSVAASA